MKTSLGEEGNFDAEMAVDSFKALFENSPLAVYRCDNSGYIKYYNNAAVKLWGRTPVLEEEQWCGSWKIYYPDGRPIPPGECPMAQCVRSGKSLAGEEMTIERPDHSFSQVMVYPQPLKDEKGNITGAYNTLIEVTRPQNVAQEQSVLSAIVESSDDAIISKNLQGIITSWNQAAQKIFGYTPEEIIGQSINKLIPEELHGEEKEIIQNIRNGKKVDHFQTTRITKTGKLIKVSLTSSPVKDAAGVIVGASKIVRDISDQLQREEELKQSADRMRMLNSIGKSISEKLDVHAILQNVTDATTRITGAAFGAFFYNSVNELGESLKLFTLSGLPREAFEGMGMPRNTAVFGPTFTGEGVLRVDDITEDERYGKNSPHHGMPAGHPPVKSFLSVPVISNSGTVIGGLFFGHPKKGVFQADHEELIIGVAVQAAVALDNSRLFEEVSNLNKKKDEFIALASHELKTPMTTIKGYLQILQKKEDDAVKQLFLSKCLKQVNQLSKLVGDLFDVTRIEAGKLQLSYERYDLKEMLKSMVETFQYTNPSHQVILNWTTSVVEVNADKQKIEQVLTNVLSNAIKYSPGENKIGITVELSGQNLKLSVIDTGVGLSQEQQKKIFTRFYRGEGEALVSGLGLGLYLSKEIMERHKGQITVISELGKGSEFVLWLPI